MNIKDIKFIIGNNIQDNEQISLPFISMYDGKKVVGFFTYDSRDVSDELMVIDRIRREIYIDPETGEMYIREINSDETHEITFDTFYDLDTLDEMYKEYDAAIDSYLKEEISIKELDESFKKLCPKSFVNLYRAEGLMEKEMNQAYTDSSNDEEYKESMNEDKERRTA